MRGSCHDLLACLGLRLAWACVISLLAEKNEASKPPFIEIGMSGRLSANAFHLELQYNATVTVHTFPGGSTTILDVIKLGCVRGDRRLFSNLSFSLGPGTYLQVTGSNGSGKTSLLRILCSLVQPAEGKVEWQGTEIHSLGEEYFSSVTYVGHKHGVKEELTAAENLRLAAGLNGTEIDKHAIQAALEKVGLEGRESLATRLLSEGQRRRISLARLIISNTKLWLLDEILSSLDKASVALVRSLIEEHLAGGGIAIVATHQELELNTSLVQRLELKT